LPILTSLAGTMRRRGMTEDAIAAALIVTNRDRCRPPLDEDEVRTIARSVAGYEPAEDAADGPGLVPLGECDPVTGRPVLSPKRTLPTAEAYLSEFLLREGLRTLHGYGGQLLEWRDNRYLVVEDDAFKARLQPWLHAALRYQKKRNGDMELVPFDSNPTTVNASLESIRTRAYLPVEMASPCWLGDEEGRP